MTSTTRTARRALTMTTLCLGLVVGGSGVAAAYTVAEGDTLSRIAARQGVSINALVGANNISNPDRIIAGTELVIPDGNGGTTSARHTVRPGETLSGIAAQYGVSVRALAEANGISDPNRIVSGVTLAVQRGGGGAAAAPPAATSSSAPGRSADSDTVRRLITEAAQRHGWRPAVPLGLAMQESGWNNSVVSSAGARGIMQVMPATGEWVGTYLLKRPLDLGDPADNVAAGMAYLDYLYDRFDGNVENALAAYFEGPRRTEGAGGPSTPGAQRYVDNVMALADRYR